MKFNQLGKNLAKLFLIMAMGGGWLAANSRETFAQFTFNGDYDRAFGAPNGYVIDPPNQTGIASSTNFVGGVYNPDGTTVALGRITSGSGLNSVDDFYLKKFTASGALDSSFGSGGYVETNFFPAPAGNVASLDIPNVIKRQPDGKIIAAGSCGLTSGYDRDVCAVRYNADGSLDATFGNITVPFQFCDSNHCEPNMNFSSGTGKVLIQTGAHPNGTRKGSTGYAYDMAIQPDGKIILVGESRPDAPNLQTVGFLLRLNANGSIDTTFGTNGIATYTGTATACSATREIVRRLYGIALQTDGRIIAVGQDAVTDAGCNQGNVFVVTRWSASGQLETSKRLDNTTNTSANEKAVAAIITKDNKVLVSGSYQTAATLTRFNLTDLSIDTTFGTNGITSYVPFGTNTLYIKAVQPDGKILGVDTVSDNGVVRFNPNGTSDQSFGNVSWQINNVGVGRIRLNATYNGLTQPFQGYGLIPHPDGKFNIVGQAGGGNSERLAIITQQNTTLRSGIYSDFTNDGKSDISVFRSGSWYYLDSATNQFSGATFGQAGDKPIPADFDGDGKTDLAVYRPSAGAWYILQSGNNQFRAVQFGASEDLPRPGDFDGDGRADIAVFRPSTGGWYYLRSSDNQFSGVTFGQSGDLPLLGDFDGDGKSDIAVFRNGVWYYLQSSDGQFRGVSFGLGSDIPTVGDYDGDGKSDIAVFRPANGFWYRLNSTDGAFIANQFGQNGDKPVAADYDNDGRTDLAVFRSGSWYGLRSGDNSVFGVAFGAPTDVPIPASYLP